MNIDLAVIGGSSAFKILKNQSLGNEEKCEQIKTPFGKSANIHTFLHNDIRFLFMSRHGDKGYNLSAPFINYRANIWALKEKGVQRIISWSGPGILNTKYSVGDYVLPNDYIDETKRREYTFFNNTGIGFIRQKDPFCQQIRESLTSSAHGTKATFHKEGVYVCTEGPRLETPAEIRKFKLFGGDMVGMTLIPEAQLARELEICYASICYMTNYAEGVSDRPYKKGELFEGMLSNNEAEQVESAVSNFPDIIFKTFTLLNKTKRTCECKDAMLRYKKRGDIDENWRDWIDNQLCQSLS